MPVSQQRAYGSANYLVELGGASAGAVRSAAGGLATSDVVAEKLGADQIARKHLAGVKYTDIELECGTGMSSAFYDWIADTLDRRHSRKDGAIVTMDYNHKVRSRRSFYGALISEVAFPALDAASKDSAKLGVKLTPEYTRVVKPTAVATGEEQKVGSGKQEKKWLPANFRLTIDGLDCTKVSKIEPLVVTSVMVEQAVGEQRDYEREPAHLEVPDLIVTLAESGAKSFEDWHEDFVVKGNNDASHEKSGKLQFLSANLSEVLFELSFSGLGIYKLAPDELEAASESIRRVTASMYCEEIKLSSHAGVAPTPPPPPPPPPPPNGESAMLGALTGDGRELVTGDFPRRFTRVRFTA